MAFKVSVIFDSLTVPLSLTTYSQRQMEREVGQEVLRRGLHSRQVQQVLCFVMGGLRIPSPPAKDGRITLCHVLT